MLGKQKCRIMLSCSLLCERKQTFARVDCSEFTFLHVGVFPLHLPLGKHLLTAGPIIVYPGLQRYLIYSPAQ